MPELSPSVKTISFCFQTSLPIDVTVTGDYRLDDVTLWYPYLSDNSTWGSYSTFWGDTSKSWKRSFNFPDGNGYYEFYRIGRKYGSPDENFLIACDVGCKKIWRY